VLLDLPTDLLRLLFTTPYMDAYSLVPCRFTCRKLARLIRPARSDSFCSEAARRGELKLRQWARSNGCPWDMVATGTGQYAALPPCMDTWPCCSGRAQTAASGMSSLAQVLRLVASWRCCSGRAQMTVLGKRTHAPGPPSMVIWRCCNGLARPAAPGTPGPAIRPLTVAI
jgi:hypothetical protein